MARNKHPEQTRERILDVSSKLFLMKGYENTTIQDIINELQDLSKGAIYHHFKSKEEIIIAVAEHLQGDLSKEFGAILEVQGYTGLEKLKKTLLRALNAPHQKQVAATLPDLLQNPKYLALQIKSTLYELSPLIIEPLIRLGIEDGSIQTEFPKELSETISILTNIWMNPFIFYMSEEELEKKFLFFKELMEKLHVPVVDDEILFYMKELRSLSKG